MFLGKLLRLPGASCAEEALTGDDILDGYIRELDARLLGSRAVRLLTLAEIKDHLTEAKAAGVASGLDEGAAAGEAVDAMGPAEEHAREQRGTLWVRFWKTGGIAAIVVAIVTGLFQFTPVLPFVPLRALVLAGAMGLSVSLLVVATATYRWPRRWINAKPANGDPSSACFDVTLAGPIAIRMKAYLVGVGFAMWSGVIILAVSDISRPGPAVHSGLHYWVLLVAILGTCWALYDLSITPRRFRVGAAGFSLETWTGSERHISWTSTVSIGTCEGSSFRFWVFAPRKGSYIYIEYRSGSGSMHLLPLRRDMLNADRFLQMVEENVRRNACPDGSA